MYYSTVLCTVLCPINGHVAVSQALLLRCKQGRCLDPSAFCMLQGQCVGRSTPCSFQLFTMTGVAKLAASLPLISCRSTRQCAE